MNNQELAAKLRAVLEEGTGDAFTDFVSDHGEQVLAILESEEASEDEDVPAHMREDGLALARMEMMYDAHADTEGGDLYSDADNPEMPCPVCGKYDDFCEAWGECDTAVAPEDSEDAENSGN